MILSNINFQFYRQQTEVSKDDFHQDYKVIYQIWFVFCPSIPILRAQELQLVCSLLYSRCLEQHLAHEDVGINFLVRVKLHNGDSVYPLIFWHWACVLMCDLQY